MKSCWTDSDILGLGEHVPCGAFLHPYCLVVHPRESLKLLRNYRAAAKLLLACCVIETVAGLHGAKLPLKCCQIFAGCGNGQRANCCSAAAPLLLDCCYRLTSPHANCIELCNSQIENHHHWWYWCGSALTNADPLIWALPLRPRWTRRSWPNIGPT